MIKTKELLKEIKDDRKKNLMGLTIDIEYFDQFLASQDEADLRKKLDAENAKVEYTKKGKIKPGKGDPKVIAELSVKLQKINGIKEQKNKFVQTRNDILVYLKLIEELPEKVVKELEKIQSI